MDNPIRKLFDPAALPPRDEDGTTVHPDLERFYDGTADDEGYIDSRILRDAGWDFCVIQFEYDAPKEIADIFYADGETWATWEPSIPHGNGWLLAGIWDAEDGPIAYYVREIDLVVAP